MAIKPNPHQAAHSGAPGHDLAGPVGESGTSSAVEVVRSEERLRVGAQVQVTGRAVLRKYVVTETVTQTFQVRREEVRLEHEPAAGAPTSTSGGRVPFTDGVAVEMVLHREVPRVVMDVVAVERVRLHLDTVTEQVSVSDDLRSEQVVLDTA
jgi:stress response protein YsnF